MEEEDYEIIPHNEILKLKKEIDELKNSTGSEIKNAMHELTGSINNMNSLLKDAAEGMKTEESEALALNKRMDLLIKKLDVIADENKKIAESMITLGELMKARFSPQQMPKMPQMPRQQQPSFQGMPPPRQTINRSPQTGPRPFAAMPPPIINERNLPPLPPFEDKGKKGLFGKLMK